MSKEMETKDKSKRRVKKNNSSLFINHSSLINILLVEDNPADVRLVREAIVEVNGVEFNLECADRLSAGLKLLGEKKFDLLLLDLILPDSYGFETFERVRSWTPEIPIVVLTALGNEFLGIEAIRTGAEDYLVKGDINGNILTRSIRYSIERKRSEKVLKESISWLSKKNRYEAIVHAVARSVHRSINLQDVLDGAVEAMSKNVGGAEHVAVYMVEGDAAVLKAHVGHPDWFIRRAGTIPRPRGFTWETILRGTPKYCADTYGDGAIGPAGRELGIKSYVSMPVHSGGGVVGCVNVNSFRKHAFGEEEVKLFEDIVKQIEVAVNNAKQAEELRKSKEELELRVEERTRELSRINEELRKEIEERKSAGEALRESEKRFASFMRYLPGAAWIKDGEGRYVYANETAERIFSTTLNDLLGKTDEEIFPANTAKQFRENDRTAIASKKVLRTIETLPMDDGIHHSIVNKFPIPDQDGTPALVGGVALDITERMQAENALREREQELKIALGTARLGNWQLDLITGTLYSSDQCKANFGLPPEADLPYQLLFELIHPDDRERVQETVRRSIDDYADYDIEYRNVWYDGSVHWIVARGRCIYGANGEPLRMVGVTLDITERKQAEEQMRASLREKEVLLREIHHRVKNNLQIVSSLLNLQSRHIANGKTREIFKESQNRVKSMALIHEKLYQSDDFESINFADYIKGLLKYLLGSYRTDSSKTKLKISADNIFLDIEKAIPCGLIVNELVSNSLKHAFPERKEGEIWVECRYNPDDNLYTLIAGNNGVPFPENVDFRKTKSLGLQLVCALVDQLRGTIELDRGGGTEFRIKFNL